MEKAGKLHIARPARDVALNGGRAAFDVSVGSRIKIHPAHDYFMMGAQEAEVRGWNAEASILYVRLYAGGAPVPGKLRALHADYVLPPRGV